MVLKLETRPQFTSHTRRLIRRCERFLSTAFIPALLLAPVCVVHACLDEIAQEYGEVITELDVHGPPESWADAAVPMERSDQAAALTALADIHVDQERFLEAEPLLERAIDLWLRENHVPGELCARRILAVSQGRKGAVHDALATVSLAEARARETGHTTQLHRIVYLKIRLSLILNDRLEEALLQLERHPPGDDATERMLWIDTRAALLNRLGRLRPAIADYDWVLKHAAGLGHDDLRAAALINRARAVFGLASMRVEPINSEDLASEAERVIQDPASPPEVKLMAMLFLADMHRTAPNPEALENCHRLALDTGHTNLAGACLGYLALAKAESQPDRAAQLMNEAIALVEQNGTARDRQRLVLTRILLDWKLHPPIEAMHRSLEYTDLTEDLRRQQTGGEARARFLALWSYIDRLLAGLAYAHANDHPELLAPALMVLESTRAQVLQELRLDDGAPEETAQATAQRISEIQRALIEAPTTPGQIEDLHEQLRRLDLEFRQALLVAPEAVPSPGPPPGLDALQAALAPGEALLSALTDTALQETREDGWMHVITREQSFAVRIPGHLQLTRWSRTLAGMNNWSTPAARRMLEQTGQALLEPVLRHLPDDTRRLILVPDKGLHELPLAALTLPDGRPLGMVFELEIAPSAGLWLALRETPKSRGSALVLADPDLPAAGYQRLDPAFAESLDALYGARDEAERIRARLGSGAEILHGAQATESALTAPALSRHSVLHFGAHALIHPTVPSRSAIVLTPFGQEDDGLLQPREILNLDMHGRAAVLAVCAGAAGEWVDGEGLLSLAYAFIAAGSVAVVANRWPVDDQHAQVFFDRVYRQLARGQSLAAALNRASRELYQAGYPPEAWAGYVLIGDGAWSPMDPMRSWTGLIWFLAAALLLAWAWWSARR